jgi:hypothetical protein
LPGLLAPGPFEARGQRALPSVRPFTPPCRRALLWPLLTSRSALQRRPFRREARPPQVRPSAFVARPPDLRRPPLVARASRSWARSPWRTVASYPVPVRQPAVPLPASFSAALAAGHLAVRSGPCDQVPGGLPPPCQVSCWAHQKKGGAIGAPPQSKRNEQSTDRTSWSRSTTPHRHRPCSGSGPSCPGNWCSACPWPRGPGT